jgi:hypothetical protein
MKKKRKEIFFFKDEKTKFYLKIFLIFFILNA